MAALALVTCMDFGPIDWSHHLVLNKHPYLMMYCVTGPRPPLQETATVGCQSGPEHPDHHRVTFTNRWHVNTTQRHALQEVQQHPT